jgi:HK97 family phage major capsid protein
MAITTEEFQETVLGGVKSLQNENKEQKTKTQQLLSDVDRLSGETRKALETLELVKNHSNSVEERLAAITRAQASIRSEVDRSWGSPLQRIMRNEEHKLRINAAVRQLCLDRNEKLPDNFTKAIGEDTGVGAGYITPQLAKEIYDLISEYGVYSSFFVEPVGTKTVTIPVDTVQPVCNILSEGTQIPEDTNYAGTSSSLSVKILATLIPVYRTLLDDAAYDVTGRVARFFANATAYRLDWMCLGATGANDVANGGFTGIFPGGKAANAAKGNVSIAALEYDDIARVLTTVNARVLSKRAQWWIHPQVLAQLMGIKDNNKRPIFMGSLEAPDLSRGRMGSLLGFPVNLADAAPAVDGANKPIAAFGDPDGGYLAMRSDFQFEFSDHFHWDMYSRTFRGIARAAFKIRGDNVNTIPFATVTTAAQ